MTRREVLLTRTGIAARGVLGPAAVSPVQLGCRTNAWAIDPREFSNVLAVLQKVKDYGYEGFETGLANVQSEFDSLAAACRKLNALGLKFIGVHIFLTSYDSGTRIAPADLYKRVAAGGARLGAQRLILSGAPASDEPTRRRKAEGAGALAQELALKLAYHNHGPSSPTTARKSTFYYARPTCPWCGSCWMPGTPLAPARPSGVYSRTSLPTHRVAPARLPRMARRCPWAREIPAQSSCRRHPPGRLERLGHS